MSVSKKPIKRSAKPQKEFWVRGGSVVSQNSKREIFSSDLRVVDGVIAEVRKRTKTVSLPKRSRSVGLVDARDHVLIPGFVQTHIHLCQTLFRNLADDLELLDWLKEKIWPFEAAHNTNSLAASADLGIYELLSSGTTTLLDMGTVRHTETLFNRVLKSGIRANIGKCLMDDLENNPVNLCEDRESAMREAIALFQKWNGRENDRIRAHFAPRFALSCTRELLEEVGKLSHSLKAIVHTHACENQKEIEWVKRVSGMNNIPYLVECGLASHHLVVAHGVWLDDKDRALLKKLPIHISHCPSSNLKLASGIAEIPELIEEGISVSLGADGAPCNNRLDAFTEMRLAATIHKPRMGPLAMPAQLAFDLATREGARALGWFDEIGSLEEGKRADFALLDLNLPHSLAPTSSEIISSIVYSATPENVMATFVDGVKVFERGEASRKQAKKLVELGKKELGLLLKRVKRS